MIYTKDGKPVTQPDNIIRDIAVRLNSLPFVGEHLGTYFTQYCNRYRSTQNAQEHIENYAKDYQILPNTIQACEFAQTPQECWDKFQTLNDFFIRRRINLPSVRNTRREIVSPVDAYVIYNLTPKFWVKGDTFTSSELMLGQFNPTFNIDLFICRLAPHHYHRFHCPVYGRILSICTFGTKYNSVDPILIRSKRDVLTRNTRVVIRIETPRAGILYMAIVGASCAGTITLNHSVLLKSLHRSTPIDDEYIRKHPITFKPTKGPKILINEELGYFQFGGSCVVLGVSTSKCRMTPISQMIMNHSAKQFETEIEVGDTLLTF